MADRQHPTCSDCLPTPDTWPFLTGLPHKAEQYAVDLYFRESWADALHVLKSDVHEVLHHHALLIVKPDGVVGGRVAALVDFVRRHGFTVVAAAPMTMTRHSCRELWRYDWDVYPVDRLQLANLMYTVTGTVALLLHRDAGEVPSTVALSDLKGSSNPAGRTPDQLRSVLAAPNSVLNFVHVADEPADIVRELGIFFERADRRRLWGLLVAGPDQEGVETRAEATIDDVLARAPRHDLDAPASLSRLVESGAVTDEAAALLRAVIATSDTLGWDALCGLVDLQDPRVDPWDVVSLAAETLDLERPDSRSLMADVEQSHWLSLPAVRPQPACHDDQMLEGAGRAAD